MRVLASVAVTLSLAGFARAQFEGWEPGPVTPGTGAIPAAWTSVNNSPGGPGVVPNWGVRNDTAVFAAYSGTTFAWANYNSSTGANDISNYLISPVVTIANGATITFYTRTVSSVFYPDRLELVFNTTGSTNPVDFTNVLVTVNPNLTTSGYPSVWTLYTATVTGVPVPVQGRYAFHYNPTNGGPAGNNSDFIGIDDVTFTPAGGGTLATNATIGSGCYSRFNSFYEVFGAATDLSNTTWTMTANGQGGYDVVPGGAPFSAPSGTATVVTLGDDTSAAVGTLGLSVGSNGWVASGTGNSTAYAPNLATFLSNPASAVYFWHDMDPSAAGSGQVYYEETGPIAVVTYNGVYDWGGTATNSVRIEMLVAAPGVVPIIQVGFGAISTNGSLLVGYSDAAASNDPGPVDISAATLISTGSVESVPLTLAASTRPVVGTSWNLAVGNSALLDLIVLGLADPAIADLSFLGLPGCGLRATLDYISVGTTLSLAIPSNPALAGVNLFANGASFAPGANAFGMVTSNGVHGVIGTY